MDLGTISSRYARALYSLAKEQGKESIIYENLETLKRSLHETKELLPALSNPMIAGHDKQRLLTSAAGLNACDLYKRFADMVLNHKRENCLPIIIYHYLEMYRKDKNISRVVFYSAVPVTSSTQKHLTDRLQELTNKTVEYTCEVRPELIGGFRLQLDNFRIDASYATQLNDIRERLLERK